MTSASEDQEPKRKKPGPKPERLVIAPEDAGGVLDHLLKKKPEGDEKPEEGESRQGQREE